MGKYGRYRPRRHCDRSFSDDYYYARPIYGGYGPYGGCGPVYGAPYGGCGPYGGGYGGYVASVSDSASCERSYNYSDDDTWSHSDSCAESHSHSESWESSCDDVVQTGNFNFQITTHKNQQGYKGKDKGNKKLRGKDSGKSSHKDRRSGRSRNEYERDAARKGGRYGGWY
jgi:hypothetical protein